LEAGSRSRRLPRATQSGNPQDFANAHLLEKRASIALAIKVLQQEAAKIDQQLQKTHVSPATVDRRCGVASAAASEEDNASGSHEGHSVTMVEGVGEPGAPDDEDPDAEFA
jgi:hypothetical protein